MIKEIFLKDLEKNVRKNYFFTKLKNKKIT